MIIEKYVCKNCSREHERRIYANKSEVAAVIFTEKFFPPIWEKIKQKAPEMPLEDFCKELTELAVYTCHKHGRSIRMAKGDLISNNSTEKQTEKT